LSEGIWVDLEQASLVESRTGVGSGVVRSEIDAQGMELGRPWSRWVVPVALILLAGFCAIFSGGFLEGDEASHYLVSRGVWGEPSSVVSIWGRVGCTAYYAL